MRSRTIKILESFYSVYVEVIELARFHAVLQTLSEEEQWLFDHLYGVAGARQNLLIVPHLYVDQVLSCHLTLFKKCLSLHVVLLTHNFILLGQVDGEDHNASCDLRWLVLQEN